MVVRGVVRRNEYRDSVVLMRISKQLEELEGVQKASAIMATENNKQLLKDAGLLTDDIARAAPNDLAVAVDAASAELAENAIAAIEGMLAEKPAAERGELVYKTLAAATATAADSNLVLISVPGPFAAREAMRALRDGKHVFIFSDGVPVEDEVKLKRLGEERGLLVMGPDCGTAIINGVGLGFSNVVRRGPIGIVGAAGTGIQQVSSLVDEVGVSHAIGTGSNDPKEAIGAITMRAGLKLLAGDPDTKVVVVVSKPPAPKVAREVLKVIKGINKPAVVNFIGGSPAEVKRVGLVPADTLEDAAVKAMALARGEKPKSILFSQKPAEIKKIVRSESKRLKPKQKYIRGLYSGGTFCYEAMLILRKLVGGVYSNTPLDPKLKLADVHRSQKHTCVDLGTGVYTVGRPHPMIDFRFRQERLLREAADPETAVILFDIVLGYGAHPDPAGEIAPTIQEAKKIAERDGRYLPVVASVCGTQGDPQGLAAQEKKLRDVGVVVMPSNAQAVRMAALIATHGKAWGKLK
ncbi:MAG: acyl-CoA synthetase FdrA [Hadesarchaea archaeon]|nr:acyl-CoA synthetase FdrA [Hadesarchaea archaeon]